MPRIGPWLCRHFIDAFIPKKLLIPQPKLFGKSRLLRDCDITPRQIYGALIKLALSQRDSLAHFIFTWTPIPPGAMVLHRGFS